MLAIHAAGGLFCIISKQHVFAYLAVIVRVHHMKISANDGCFLPYHIALLVIHNTNPLRRKAAFKL